MRLVLLLVLLGCSEPRAMKSPPPVAIARPRIVAHRGASHDLPENTLAAFKRAWSLGVEAVELDVHVTSDGQVVVMHDPTTKRMTGVDRVIADSTAAELATLEIPGGGRIPTLREAFATIPPGHAMFVELKSGASTVSTVAAAIRTGRPSSATILLQGYDPDVLGALAAELPDAPAYWTVDPELQADGRPVPYPHELVHHARRRGFPGVALREDAVTDEFLDEARNLEVAVDVWTVNDPARLTYWAAREVRWIETDRPDLAPAKP